MVCDIIFSTAWCCGEKDCKQQWHQANYWIQGDGTYTVDNYADGDHETIDEGDLPSYAEVEKSWVDYSRFVLRTGTDPLCDFLVPRETKKVRKYSATFVDSILGLMLVAVRTAGGKPVPLGKMPEELDSYLNVEGKGRRLIQRDLANVEECRTISGCKVFTTRGRRRAVFTCEVEFRVPKSEKVVAAALRKAARKHLREKGGE
jgi:hypothetical protein